MTLVGGGENMRKIGLAAILLVMPGMVRADHDTTVAIDKGTYPTVDRVSGSSTAGTAFPSISPKLMDGMYFNNTANVIWVGTVTANQFGSDHPNNQNGFPWLSSSTISLGGKFTGAIYFTCGAGISACEIRRLETLNR